MRRRSAGPTRAGSSSALRISSRFPQGGVGGERLRHPGEAPVAANPVAGPVGGFVQQVDGSGRSCSQCRAWAIASGGCARRRPMPATTRCASRSRGSALSELPEAEVERRRILFRRRLRPAQLGGRQRDPGLPQRLALTPECRGALLDLRRSRAFAVGVPATRRPGAGSGSRPRPRVRRVPRSPQYLPAAPVGPGAESGASRDALVLPDPS